MNTGPQERLTYRDLAYRDLARQQAQVERSISLQDFSRLTALAGAGTAAQTQVSVTLEFYQNLDGEPCVRGNASVALELLCHRCAEMVVYPLEASFDVLIVDEAGSDAESIARKAEHNDLFSVSGTSVCAVEIAEDDLLLALPERLCRREPCELMPELAYPAQGSTAEQLEQPEPSQHAGSMRDSGTSSETRKPFAGLADMLAQGVAQKKSSGSGQGDDDA